MLTVAIENQALELTMRNIAESEGKPYADIVRDALMRHPSARPTRIQEATPQPWRQHPELDQRFAKNACA